MSILRSLAAVAPTISSQAFSPMLKPFFPTTSRSFWTLYGYENLNVIHSFKVTKRPWSGNYMLQGKGIPRCGHRLSFFISYSKVASDSEDFPSFDQDGSNVEVKVSSFYKWIEPARQICFRPIGPHKDGDCVKDGKKVTIHYKLYNNDSHEERYSTYSNDKPVTIGPGENEICQGLYEGIVGMRLEETRRIVVPPSSDLTGDRSKGRHAGIGWRRKPSAYSEEHRIYDVHLLKINP